jgi:hypothetical protein
MDSRITSGEFNEILGNIKQNIDQHSMNTQDYVNGINGNTRKVLLQNNSWTDASERILITYGESITFNKKVHERSIGINKTTSNIFNVTFIIISVVLTVITSIESLIPETLISQFVRIGLSGILTILSLVYNFFSFDENCAKHTEAFKKYSKLYNIIQRQLCLHRSERNDARTFIPQIQAEYDDIKSESISITHYNGNTGNTGNTGEMGIMGTSNEGDNKSLILKICETPLELINNSLKIHGDLKDEDVQNIPLVELDHLNKTFLNKRNDYEFSRYMNHSSYV